MTKRYDYAKAKENIEQGEGVESATLGIAEDWYWTAQEVYSADKGFLLDLETRPQIAGIHGSRWGTPFLEIEYTDGSIDCSPCFLETETVEP